MLSTYEKEFINHYFTVNCYYHRTYADFTMPIHSHKRIEIMYVEYGELKVEYYEKSDEKKTLVLLSHDYVIIDADVKHTIIVPSVSTRIINLEMDLSAKRNTTAMTLQSLMATDRNVEEFLRSNEPVIKLSDFNNLAQLLLIMQDNLDKSSENYQNTFIDFTLASLFVQIGDDYRTQKKHPVAARIKYVRKAVYYIHMRYQFPISSAEVAEYANVSQNYLNALFKKDFGQTIVDYLNAYRISKAKSIIEKSTIPYSMIFSQVGYRTKQNFNKNFLRYTGMTPREYRNGMRTKDNTHWTPEATEKTTLY